MYTSTGVAEAIAEGRSLATEQDFVPEKIVVDESSTSLDMSAYTQYVDPSYSEQLMSESLVSDEDLPSVSLPKKAPVEPPVEVKAEEVKATE